MRRTELKRISTKIAYRLSYPEVPCLFTTTHETSVAAMPALSQMVVSNDPALQAVALSPEHFTYHIVRKSRKFALSWLDKKYEDAMDFLGSKSGSQFADKLKAAGLPYFHSSSLGLPIPEPAVAYVECTLQDEYAIGDHVLLIGKIEGAFANGDFDSYWGFKSYEPLLYRGSKSLSNPRKR